MIPSDTQIANEIRALPGLGRMQAINRIQGREFIQQQRREAVFAPREAEENPFATIEEYWRNPAPFDAEIKANRDRAHACLDRHRDAALIAAGLIDAPVARTQESF